MRLMTLRVVLLLAALSIAAVPARAADTRDPDQHFFNLNTGDLKAESGDARKSGKKAILVMF